MTKRKRDYAEIIEDMDSRLVAAFSDVPSGTDAAAPDLRYYMLVALFQFLGRWCPGANVEKACRAIGRQLGTDYLADLTDCARDVAKLFLRVVRPTYVAASYWNPIDKRRHTVQFREKPPDGHAQTEILAYAYAFYALTLGGRPKYFSTTQFVIDKAQKRRSYCVCYANSVQAQCRTPVWHIPSRLHRSVLIETGIAEAVTKVVLKDGRRAEHEISDALGLAIMNERGRPWQSLDSFPESFIESFDGVCSEVSSSIGDMIDHTREYVRDRFGNDIGPQQALFMVMTNIMYNAVVCPTKYFYGFPVRLPGRSCSVMTVGTRNALDSLQHIALWDMAQALFKNPLLLDYAARESSDNVNKWTNTINNTVSHCLKTWVASVEAAMEDLGEGHPECKEIDAYRRMESAVGSLNEATQMATNCAKLEMLDTFQEIDINDTVATIASSVSPSKIEFKVGRGKPRCMADRFHVGNAVLELVNNALRQEKMMPEPLKILIWTEVVGKKCRIHVKDNGPGLPQELVDSRKLFKEYVACDWRRTGMGLYYVGQVVRRHGGSVRVVKDARAQGAHFVLELPTRREGRP
ncbi:MAG: HAMP domain-containing sensor histidine kinase [Phycisphaerales bacterium]